jgi:hypothetical protein
MTKNYKAILTITFLLLIYSSGIKAQLELSDTLIYEYKGKRFSTFFEIYPDSTYYYYTKTCLPKYHSEGTVKKSNDTLIISSETIELKNIDTIDNRPSKTLMWVWLNLDQEKFLIEKDNLIRLPDMKEKYKKIKKE